MTGAAKKLQPAGRQAKSQSTRLSAGWLTAALVVVWLTCKPAFPLCSQQQQIKNDKAADTYLKIEAVKVKGPQVLLGPWLTMAVIDE